MPQVVEAGVLKSCLTPFHAFKIDKGNFDERRLLCETVLKRLYVKEGKITKVELNLPFALIASRACGSESVLNVGDTGLEPVTSFV